MSKVMFGYVNYLKSGTISTAGSPPTSYVIGLEPTNLASDQVDPSLGWQTQTGIKTAAAGAYVQIGLSTPGPVRAFGIGKCNLTAGASVTFEGRLSGSTVFTKTVGGPSAGYAQVVTTASNDVTVDTISIQIDDSSNPDNHISVGWAFAGSVWNPSDELGLATQGVGYQPKPTRQETKTRGGQRFIQPFYTERTWAIALNAVTDDEAWDDLGELIRVANLGSNVLFIPNYSSTEINREAVFGVLDTAENISFANNIIGRRSWASMITERN
jgi:hypothetical protein